MIPPEETDEDYYIPLQDQKVWGAGIKRKRIVFVPAGSHQESTSISTGESAASRYLSIVMKDKIPAAATPSDHSNAALKSPSDGANSSDGPTRDQDPATCPVCKMSLDQEPQFTEKQVLDLQGASKQHKLSRHESSIAHQLCLAHVHPPSALDRTGTGAKYLASYGWDPDSRLGLGARGEGITAPVKARIKNNTIGIAVENERRRMVGKRTGSNPTTGERGSGKDFKLNAAQVRKQVAEDRQKADRLRLTMFGDDKLAKYLGEDA